MRILLQYSHYSYKTTFYASKLLNKLILKSSFAYLGISNQAEKFINKNIGISDISFRYFDDEKRTQILKTYNINYDLLREFDLDLEDQSIWKLIAMDRSLGRSYMHGAIGYKNKFHKDREYILKYFSYIIEYYTSVFKDFKPDIFIPAFFMANISLVILETLCKKYNVIYLVPDSLRIYDYCSMANNSQLQHDLIKELYKKTMSGKQDINQINSLKIYEQVLLNKENKIYFDRLINIRAFKYISVNSNLLIKFLYLTALIPAQIIYDIYRQILTSLFKTYINKNLKNNFFKSIYSKIKWRIQIGLQKIKITNPNLYDKIEKDDKYIFFPLTGQPEYGSNVLGTMWMDQIHLIQSISKSLPFDYFLYVKEHPAVTNDRIRPKDFYKRIKSLPNVKLISINYDSIPIIQNSLGVFVISGTVGWEAIIRNKPVIEIRDNIWSILGLSKKCNNIEEIYLDLTNEIERINNFDQNERKKRLLHYFNAINKIGFQSKYPDVMFYDRAGSDEEFKCCGEEIGHNICQHLKILNKI